LVRQRCGLTPHRHARRLQTRCKRIQRGRVRHLETEIALPIGERAVHDKSLFAVIHPEGAAGIAALDHLHAEPPGREIRPVRQVGGTHPDITQRLNFHATSLPILLATIGCSAGLRVAAGDGRLGRQPRGGKHRPGKARECHEGEHYAPDHHGSPCSATPQD